MAETSKPSTLQSSPLSAVEALEPLDSANPESTAKTWVPPHLRTPQVQRKPAPAPKATPVVDSANDVTSSPPAKSSPITPQVSRTPAPETPMSATKAPSAVADKPHNISNGHNSRAHPKPNTTLDEDQLSRSRSNGKRPANGKKTATKDNGWHQPVTPSHPLVNDWDGSPVDVPEDWEGRSRKPIPKVERKTSLDTWFSGQGITPSAGEGIVDITSPDFTLGTGVVHETSITSGKSKYLNVYLTEDAKPKRITAQRLSGSGLTSITGPSNQAHFTRRLPNDPLTLARVEQTAQAKVEEYMAKKQGENGKKEPTKEEKRANRRALQQLDQGIAASPNPYKPIADIYIRPAQAKDLQQIT